MQNDTFSHYLKNGIHTEHGVDENWEKHIKRRRNLYRQLGIPTIAFSGADILEIGPGIGHNSVPLLKEWGGGHIDFVEANPLAVEQLKRKFEKYNISQDRYSVKCGLLGEVTIKKTYDFVVAEGWIHSSDNWKECLSIMDSYMHKDSVLIITCEDNIGLYVERMKNIVAKYILLKEKDEDKRRELARKMFGPSIIQMKNMSRTLDDYIEDWIFADHAMSSTVVNQMDAIQYLKNEYDILGASQNLFEDRSWYKDYDYDYYSSYILQYESKRHTFLVAGDDSINMRQPHENKMLEDSVINAYEIGRKVGYDSFSISGMCDAIQTVSNYARNDIITRYNEELLDIWRTIEREDNLAFDSYPTYLSTFGKGMQYISFVKK